MAHALEELHARNGLPSFAAQLKQSSGELRVAYLGGSITAAEGWRVLTTNYLRSTYPALKITEITAGLPGTGSDVGVCRLEHDVLVHRPDLVFVEFAVNDSKTAPEKIERTIEGIVRQIKQSNPQTDICFVYTISTPGMPDLEAGRFPPSAQAMERVADHYGIGSIHFGVEVEKQVRAGRLTFKGTESPDIPKLFSIDGVHPTPAGHEIYFDVVKRTLPVLIEKAAMKPSAMPAALHADNWSGAHLWPISETMRRGEWTAVALDDANLRGATKALLDSVWRTPEAGAAIEFEFTGQIFGLLGIASPDNGEFKVTVDDLPPVEGTFFDAYVTPTFCRQREWFYPQTLAPGKHRVRIELLQRPFDKVAIKAAGNKPTTTPEAFEGQRLTLVGVMAVETSP